MALRRRWYLLICAVFALLAGTVGPGLVAGSPSALPHAAADPTGELLWELNPSGDLEDTFQSLEEEGDSVISAADDPKGQYGPSVKYEIGDVDGKDRCESKGHQVDGEDLTFGEQGKVYYIGWRSLWEPMSVDGGWVAFWQLKHYGSGEGGGPLALRTTQDGKLHLQYDPPGDDDGDPIEGAEDGHVWSTDLKIGEWQSFVVGFQVSLDPAQPGWLEFWYNGEQVRFTNGETRIEMLIRPGTEYVTDKWGVYRSGEVSGEGTAYLNAAKVGTSYEAVAPEEPATTPTPTDLSTTEAPNA
jgi:hypothetical protein